MASSSALLAVAPALEKPEVGSERWWRKSLRGYVISVFGLRSPAVAIEMVLAPGQQ
jgi:hypothetical protein